MPQAWAWIPVHPVIDSHPGAGCLFSLCLTFSSIQLKPNNAYFLRRMREADECVTLARCSVKGDLYCHKVRVLLGSETHSNVIGRKIYIYMYDVLG